MWHNELHLNSFRLMQNMHFLFGLTVLLWKIIVFSVNILLKRKMKKCFLTTISLIWPLVIENMSDQQQIKGCLRRSGAEKNKQGTSKQKATIHLQWTSYKPWLIKNKFSLSVHSKGTLEGTLSYLIYHRGISEGTFSTSVSDKKVVNVTGKEEETVLQT